VRTDPDNFRELAVLLAWKRNERPPPGYFDSFSRQVMARLRMVPVSAPSPWWEKWLDWFDARPVVVGACGVAVCSLLVAAFSLSQEREVTPSLAFQPASTFALIGESDSLLGSNHIVQPAGSWGSSSSSSIVPAIGFDHDSLSPRLDDLPVVPVSLNYR
jgi:hypothetical protein